MLYLDTTTSASSPVEGTTTSASSPVEGTTTSASSPVEGTWCESHIMAPAVCILNPSNGTHNCRPGWRTCLGSTPSGSVPLYACACPKPPGRTKKAQVRLASPSERRGGFGTCGWRGAGRPKPVQPLVAADVMPARVHAVRVRDYDRLRRARFTTLAALRTCFGPRADPDSRTQGPSSTPT